MLTRARDHSLRSKRSAGSGAIAGLSTAANCVSLEPSRLRNGRWLIRSRSSLIAWFNSSIEKNLRFRSAAMIQRSANCTPDSTLALSRGLYGRAGTTSDTIMHGHLLIGRIQIGIVAAGFG